MTPLSWFRCRPRDPICNRLRLGSIEREEDREESESELEENQGTEERAVVVVAAMSSALIQSHSCLSHRTATVDKHSTKPKHTPCTKRVIFIVPRTLLQQPNWFMFTSGPMPQVTIISNSIFNTYCCKRVGGTKKAYVACMGVWCGLYGSCSTFSARLSRKSHCSFASSLSRGCFRLKQQRATAILNNRLIKS